VDLCNILAKYRVISDNVRSVQADRSLRGGCGRTGKMKTGHRHYGDEDNVPTKRRSNCKNVE
jgi:hypothetical protein